MWARCRAWSGSASTTAAPACACAASSSPSCGRRAAVRAGASGGRRARTICREIARHGAKSWTARDRPMRDRDHPLYRQFPEAWLESQVRAQIERWMPRCCRTRSTARCRHSPAASAASWICWRWTARAAGGDRAEGVGRSAPAAAGAGLLDPREMAPGPRRIHALRLFSRHRAADRSAAPAAGVAVAGISSHHGNHIGLSSHPRSKWSESGWG